MSKLKWDISNSLNNGCVILIEEHISSLWGWIQLCCCLNSVFTFCSKLMVSLRCTDLISVLSSRVRVLVWPTSQIKKVGISYPSPASLSYVEDAIGPLSLPEGELPFFKLKSFLIYQSSKILVLDDILVRYYNCGSGQCSSFFLLSEGWGWLWDILNCQIFLWNTGIVLESHLRKTQLRCKSNAKEI